MEYRKRVVKKHSEDTDNNILSSPNILDVSVPLQNSMSIPIPPEGVLDDGELEKLQHPKIIED